MAINKFYTRNQDFRIKTHYFPKVNSAEQYEAQTILMGCHHSQLFEKYYQVSQNYLLVPPQNSCGMFYRFKTEM